jgi:hypothetical protein
VRIYGVPCAHTIAFGHMTDRKYVDRALTSPEQGTAANGRNLDSGFMPKLRLNLERVPLSVLLSVPLSVMA